MAYKLVFALNLSFKGVKMKEIKTKIKGRNVQRIVVTPNDKYGIAMIAYFKNSLNGQNVQRLAVKDKQKVQLWFDEKSESYILQILDFRIANVLSHYNCFLKKYDILIKDKIAHL